METHPKITFTKTDSISAIYGILFFLSLSHLLNDSIQALISAVYPLLKQSFDLNFTQIGLITLTFQMTSSIFQPLIGFYTDRNPKPFSLVIGMGITLCGLILLAFAPNYPILLIAAGLVGTGSAIFHPEASRMVRLTARGQYGFAQSFFQLGGNLGTSLGPLLAAWIIVPHGQRYILIFTILAFLAMIVLTHVGRWYASHLKMSREKVSRAAEMPQPHPTPIIVLSMTILLALMFAKFFYLALMTNYYTFYLIHRFGVSIEQSQLYLFLFLFSGAVGTIVGGSVTDRIGSKKVIWISILGALPFALMLPHVNLLWAAVLTVIIGFINSSAFSAILLYATELLPGKVGMVAGLFFGLAFGLAGIGSAVLGKLADMTSIEYVISICAYLPAIGFLALFLPNKPLKN